MIEKNLRKTENNQCRVKRVITGDEMARLRLSTTL